MPLALPAKFCGDGLLGLGPVAVVAPEAAVAPPALLPTPDTITGSSESSAIPVFFIGAGGIVSAVLPDYVEVGAGLMKLGISFVMTY